MTEKDLNRSEGESSDLGNIDGVDPDELLLELLGEVDPFEWKSKEEYDLITLSSGIEAFLEKMVSQLGPKLQQASARRIVFQVAQAEPLDERVRDALVKLATQGRARGLVFFGYPDVQFQGCEGVIQPVMSLQDFLCTAGLIQKNGINSEIVESFCVALRMTLQVQFKTRCEFNQVSLRRAGVIYPGYSGVVEIYGNQVSAGLYVSMGQATLEGLMQRMAGNTQGIPQEVILNGVTELVNIVGGQARAILNDAGYVVRMKSIPSLVPPEFQNILARGDGSHGVMIEVETDLGPLTLEARFFS